MTTNERLDLIEQKQASIETTLQELQDTVENFEKMYVSRMQWEQLDLLRQKQISDLLERIKALELK